MLRDRAHTAAQRLGQWLQVNTPVAQLIRYRLKNSGGQCRTTPAIPAVYKTTDMAAVSVASSYHLLSNYLLLTIVRKNVFVTTLLA